MYEHVYDQIILGIKYTGCLAKLATYGKSFQKNSNKIELNSSML